MPQFLLPVDSQDRESCVIRGTDADHLIRVRRARVGETVRLRDYQGNVFFSRIESVGAREVWLKIIEKSAEKQKRIPDITLCLSILKGKNFDLAVQKAVEVGVRRIVPVRTQRTVPELKGKEKSRIERWQRIADEALKQSMGAVRPFVDEIFDFGEAASDIVTDRRFIANLDQNIKSGSWKKDLSESDSIALLIGPEGGFSESEISTAAASGWSNLHYGCTQLRAETAAIVLPALIIDEWSSQYENKTERE